MKFVLRRLVPLVLLALLWAPAASAWSWPVQGPVLQQFSFDPAWWAAYSRDPTAFFARPYDWKAAVKLMPQNPSCTAGARPQKLDVRFAP